MMRASARTFHLLSQGFPFFLSSSHKGCRSHLFSFSVSNGGFLLFSAFSWRRWTDKLEANVGWRELDWRVKTDLAKDVQIRNRR
jgi:hypothetical protein